MLFYRDNDLYVMKARAEGQTNRPARLTRSRSFEGAPDWSPDGKKVAFTSHRSGNADV
jgi:Tol biopolymer transport system component